MQGNVLDGPEPRGSLEVPFVRRKAIQQIEKMSAQFGKKAGDENRLRCA
jgi:hypothetical protein